MNRVVITGQGILSPIGNNYNEVKNSLQQSINGIKLIESEKFENEPIRFAGQVKEIDPVQFDIEAKSIKKMDRHILYALASSNQAIKQSKIHNIEKSVKENIGVILGNGLGGNSFYEENFRKQLDNKARRISAFTMPGFLSNMIAGNIALKYGFRGVNYTLSSACASGTHAIGNAYQQIKYGHNKIMITGGSESSLTPFIFSSFIACKALAMGENYKTISRPWDINRNGFVMAEGSATFVLEELDHAKQRGANIIAEIIGFGASDDAYHITAPIEDGYGAYLAMKRALQDSNTPFKQIDYINAHATSTQLGDMVEAKAINRIALEEDSNIDNVSVSATKSQTGHALGASGAIESYFSLVSLLENFIPRTINIEKIENNLHLNIIKDKTLYKPINKVMCNSFGFGGTNASLVFSKFNS